MITLLHVACSQFAIDRTKPDSEINVSERGKKHYYMGGGSFGTPKTKSDCVIFAQPLGLVFFHLKGNEQNISDQVRGKICKFGLNGFSWMVLTTFPMECLE